MQFKFSVALLPECSSTSMLPALLPECNSSSRSMLLYVSPECSSGLMLLYFQNAIQVQCCFTSRLQFKFKLIVALRPECSSSSVLLYFQNAIQVQVQWCFTSTETLRTIRDGDPRTAATSIFTQFLSFEYAINGNLAFIPSVIARQSLWRSAHSQDRPA